MKRKNYISWDEYFMGIAMLSAERSKDNNTQVGACIVNKEHKIVAVGCDDDDMPWEREGETSLDTKYPFVCHAELNAILNRNSANLNECTLYVTLFPCNECAKAIIQSGIKKIVYYDNKYANSESTAASAFLFRKCGVECKQYEKNGKIISLEM